MKIGFLRVLLVFFCFSSCYQCKAKVVDEKMDLITDTCKKTRDFDICVKTLRSYPKSADSDVSGLASIIFEEALSYSNTTRNQINELLKQIVDKTTKECLSICAGLYESASVDIRRAIELLKVRSGAAYREVVDIPGEVSESATFCEGGFSEDPKRESPLTARNSFLDRLSRVAFDILRSISGNFP